MKIFLYLDSVREFVKYIFAGVLNNAVKKPLFSNTLTYAEKLIAAGMDPVRANVNAEIWPKITFYKIAIEYNLADPIKITEKIIHDISIFSEKLLATGEKQKIVELQSEALKDYVLCLVIIKFGSYSHSDQKWITKDIESEKIQHYSLKDYVKLLKKHKAGF